MLAGMLRVLSDPVPVIPRGDVPAGPSAGVGPGDGEGPGRALAHCGRSGAALCRPSSRTPGWPVTTLPVEEVPDAREAATSPTAAPAGEVTTPGLRGRIGTHRTEGRLEPAAAPRPAGDQAPTATPRPAGDQAGALTPHPTGDQSLPPVVLAGEETRSWSRRTSTPEPEPPAPAPIRRRWWWLAAAGGLAVIGVVIGVVIASGSSGPRVSPNTPRLQPPSHGPGRPAGTPPGRDHQRTAHHGDDPLGGSEQWPLPLCGEGLRRLGPDRHQPHADRRGRPQPHQGLLLRGGRRLRGGRPGRQRPAGVRSGRHGLNGLADKP